jgi:hypothetical protein
MKTPTEARRDEGCAPTAGSPKAGITPQRVMDLARVVAFAKANGFPDAEPVYWDEENPEYGQCDLEDIVHDCGEDYALGLGVDLRAGLIARKDWLDEETAEIGEITLRENAGSDAPGANEKP